MMPDPEPYEEPRELTWTQRMDVAIDALHDLKFRLDPTDPVRRAIDDLREVWQIRESVLSGVHEPIEVTGNDIPF